MMMPHATEQYVQVLRVSVVPANLNGRMAAARAVSKSPKPSVPVFLLHGIEDNVIPSIESEYLADDLRAHAPVRLLLSGLISHAEADRPVKVGDVMDLASFWGDLLSR